VAITRATQHNIPEEGILHSHRRENIKPYIFVTGTINKGTIKPNYII
jgi:hypothetical protein